MRFVRVREVEAILARRLAERRLSVEEASAMITRAHAARKISNAEAEALTMALATAAQEVQA